MKKLKNKIAVTTIALILMLTMATFMMVIPAVQAVELPTILLLNVAPNPVGVGQTVFVNAFTTNPPITSVRMMGDRWENMTVEVTRPDGTKETLGPYHSDSTGGIFVTYVPAATGNYTFQAFFPGKILTGTNPYQPGTGGYPALVGTYMMPSQSEKVTLVVQQEPIPTYASPPLPTEYWSRPIYATNFAWAALGGNWYGLNPVAAGVTGGYDAVGNFQPYTTAPNTGHILWTKPISFGGQVGAPMNADQESMYFGVTRTVRQWEPIVLNGILYYAVQPDLSTATAPVISSWEAVDLRTGETIWTKEFPAGTVEDLRMGQVLKQRTYTEYGSMAYLWSKIGSTFKIYEPLTGMYLANITGVTDVPFLIDFEANEQGTILGYYTSGGNLTMWNSTQAFAYPYGFYNATPAGIYAARNPGEYLGRLRIAGSVPWSAGLGKPGGWSVRLPTTLAGNNISLSIAARTPEVILMRQTPTIGGQMSEGHQIVAGYDAITGALLWGPLNQTIPRYEVTALLTARDGVYVLHNKDRNEAYGYSLTNGKLLWGPVKLPGNAWSPLMVGGDIAYGNVHIWDFGGFVNALDLKTGAIKWTFSPRSAGYDAPYGIYPFWCNTVTICDGKIFISESHLYTPPMFPGAQRLAINATTGELVWSILSFSGKSYAAHADGMMVQANCYDKLIYTFGKGPTAITVDAPMTATTVGGSLVIRGTVTDESPGTKDSDRKARFPHGVPAVADEYMSAWMEYVYMQQPRPTNATGVEVTLDTIDPNNNFVHIGTATSDTSGMFSYAWCPPDVPGKYTIIATFAGSESYYASYAETATVITEAPPATPPPEYPVPADYTLTIVAAAIAIIIAVAIVGIMIVRILRKRP